jgi:pimeloyl-ACP methyl ester carboxylesterase
MRLFKTLFLGSAFIVIVVIVILLLGARAKSNLKAKYPPPGTLVDVGGYHLHILCEGTGGPTVIMEAGLGDPSMIWELVRPEIAKTTRVCVYDRAGLGWSELSPKPRKAETIVEELHTLLNKADIAGPYVLVGHSIGGMYVRLYAHHYPDDVVGMVLVDSSHEEQMLRAPEAFVKFDKDSTQKMVRQLEIYKSLATIGGFALFPSLVPADDLLPKEAKEAFQATAAKDSTTLQTVIAEQKASDESLAQVRAAGIKTLGSIPLVILSHGQAVLPPDAGLSPEVTQQVEVGWQGMQLELASLSSKSRHVIAEKSGHYIHIQQPQLIIDAIKQVVSDADENVVAKTH